VTPRDRAKSERKMLIHAAGCTWRGRDKCAGVDSVPELLIDYAMLCIAAGIRPRIPRSLRK
jgi:hypothetical protein